MMMGYFYRCPKCDSLQTFGDDERPYCNNPDCFFDPYPDPPEAPEATETTVESDPPVARKTTVENGGDDA